MSTEGEKMKVKKVIGACALIISITMLLTSCGKGPVIKELKKINDSEARYWAKFVKQNGINAIDSQNNTVLLYALAKNDNKLIKACIKCGANVNLCSRGIPPILLSIINKNVDMVNLLLKNGAIVINKDYDVIRLPLCQYDTWTPFTDDSAKINELLFKKVSVRDFDKDYGSYFDFLSYDASEHQLAASRDVYERMIKKGYKIKEADIPYILRFLHEEKKHKFIIENIGIFGIENALKAVNKVYYSEEPDFNYFKEVLDLIDDANKYQSLIDEKFCEMYKYYNVSFSHVKYPENMSERIHEIVPLLKAKNFNIKESNIIFYNYDLVDEVKSIKGFERWLKEVDGTEKEHLEERLDRYVENIKRENYFEILKYLVSEGFPMNEEMQEAYTYFLENYDKE